MATLRERLSSLRTPRGGAGRVTGLFVDGGTVPCPRQGDVSVEHCLACAELTGVDGDPVTRIECRPGVGWMVETARLPIG
jgi:hypothetical protein